MRKGGRKSGREWEGEKVEWELEAGRRVFFIADSKVKRTLFKNDC